MGNIFAVQSTRPNRPYTNVLGQIVSLAVGDNKFSRVFMTRDSLWERRILGTLGVNRVVQEECAGERAL